ncbi:MAG: OmpA family protein [Cognaticolwellia sp.]
MNKVLCNPLKNSYQYLIVGCSALFLSACADTGIISLKEPVVQQHNLIDYDHDGVVKAREKCDKTTLGAAIDNYGCGTKISEIKPFKIDIKFENNSYVLPAGAHNEIKVLAEFLEKYPDINVVIEGHSSKVGSAKLNKELSNNRAKAVALMLVNDFNIDDSRISSIGYGFERLEAIGDSERVHATNRRIMAEISLTESIDELKWTIYTVDQTN